MTRAYQVRRFARTQGLEPENASWTYTLIDTTDNPNGTAAAAQLAGSNAAGWYGHLQLLDPTVNSYFNADLVYESSPAGDVAELDLATNVLGPRVPYNGTTPSGFTGAPLPPQVAMVVSLDLSFDPLVPKRLGRIYLPGMSANNLRTPGLWNSVRAQNVALAFGRWATTFTQVAPGWSLGVWRRKSGIVQFVAACAVSQVPHIIRRRAKRIPEGWFYSDFIPP